MRRAILKKAALCTLASAIYWYAAFWVGPFVVFTFSGCRALEAHCYTDNGFAALIGVILAIVGYFVSIARILATSKLAGASSAREMSPRENASLRARLVYLFAPLSIIVWYWVSAVLLVSMLAMAIGHCPPPGTGDDQACVQNMWREIRIGFALAIVGYLALIWRFFPKTFSGPVQT